MTRPNRLTVTAMNSLLSLRHALPLRRIMLNKEDAPPVVTVESSRRSDQAFPDLVNLRKKRNRDFNRSFGLFGERNLKPSARGPCSRTSAILRFHIIAAGKLNAGCGSACESGVQLDLDCRQPAAKRFGFLAESPAKVWTINCWMRSFHPFV